MTSLDPPARGQRVDILLQRGDADVWYRGTVVGGGCVHLDLPDPEGKRLLQPEEIADWRAALPH